MHGKYLVSLVFVFFALSPACGAKEIEGINLPDSIDAEGARLVLNGAGVRSRFFLDLYVSGLYLEDMSGDPKEIIESDRPMAIRLHIISSRISSRKMEKATREGFENATGGNTAPLGAKIESFISVFREQIDDGDIFDLIYAPGRGVEVFKNGQPRSVIEGLSFKQALFGIWLSDKPAQKSLKRKMLGNERAPEE